MSFAYDNLPPQAGTYATSSTAPEGVTYYFECGRCYDILAVQRKWIDLGKIVVMRWRPCPNCNAR